MDNVNQSANSFSLEGRVERFEDKMAVINTADGQTLKWPIKKIPEDLEVGSTVRLVLSTMTTDEADRDKIAKTILNKILKTAGQNQGNEHEDGKK